MEGFNISYQITSDLFEYPQLFVFLSWEGCRKMRRTDRLET